MLINYLKKFEPQILSKEKKVDLTQLTVWYKEARKLFDSDPKFKKESPRYGVVTLHRPSNVDHRGRLEQIFHALNHISTTLPLIFPIHPRTKKKMNEFLYTRRFLIKLISVFMALKDSAIPNLGFSMATN